MLRLSLVLLATFIPFIATGQDTVPEFTINKEQSHITFTAIQNNVPTKGKFNEFDGRIFFDPDNLPDSHATITVNVGSIEANYQEVTNSAKTQTWLDSSQFPQATFISENIIHLKDSLYKANGNLTIKGISHASAFLFTLVDYNETEAFIEGDAYIMRRKYNIGTGEWEKTDVVNDEVVVNVKIKATRLN